MVEQGKVLKSVNKSAQVISYLTRDQTGPTGVCFDHMFQANQVGTVGTTTQA